MAVRPVLLALAALVLPAAAHAGEPASPTVPGGPAASSLTSAAPTFGVAVAADAPDLTGAVVVDVRDDASASDVADLARTYGLTDLAPNSPLSDATDKIEIAHVAPGDVSAVVERLSRDARIEAVEPMSVLQASFVPDDPLYKEKQWHLERVGAERAWELTCGRGVTVAVVDTGVACFDKGPFTRGTDLTGTRCEGGYNFVDRSSQPWDDQGHGTHVAGTIAQTTNNGKGAAGLAYCAKLMPVKVLNRQGWGTVANVAEGIRYAADHGAQVINLSLGGNIKSRVLERSVRHARARGVTIVAAAGNSGRSVGWPAAYEGVIAVSATDANDTIAWFSSRGPEVAIAAPGVGVTQQTVCNGGRDRCELFGTFNGTSMASPHVAGAAAMVVGLGVTDPDAVRAALTASAVKKNDAALYGAGVLDAGAAALRVVFAHTWLRVLALGVLLTVVSRRILRRGGTMVRGPGFWLGALLTSVGVAPFAGLLHAGTLAGALRWVVDLAARPFGEWDLLADAALHRWLPLANALPPLALAVLFFGARRLRGLVGGFALGMAAFLAQLAWSADVSTVLGPTLLRVWVIVNALVCVWLARVSLEKDRS